MNLTGEIISFSDHIGIEITGITDAAPLYALKPILKKRFQKGMQLPFENSSFPARVDPQKSLENCKSVICIALPYNLPSPDSIKEDEPCGQVARIARIKDYHLILQEKAEQLISFLTLTSPVPFSSRFFADTGPLIERAFAARAGGIIGENTFYISRKYGSWIALGLILLDIPLHKYSPDKNNNNFCMSCGHCREACPTGALTAPYKLDPTRCMSYISQKKGIVPPEFRKLMGNRLYGCDSCQDSCPLNKDASCASFKNGGNPVLPEKIPLIPLMKITKKDFKDNFGRTAAGWRGMTTIKRNAVIALGNSNNPLATSALIHTIKNDPLSVIRLHTLWSLKRIGSTDAISSILDASQNDIDERVRKEATALLNE